jgi:hypothetical protein
MPSFAKFWDSCREWAVKSPLSRFYNGPAIPGYCRNPSAAPGLPAGDTLNCASTLNGWISMGRTSTKALERSRERRWIVVAPDGRFTTLGRASDPSEAEILAAENGLRAQGLAGWLAIMEGNPYVGEAPRIMEVRPLADPATPFSEASAACVASILARRSELAE